MCVRWCAQPLRCTRHIGRGSLLKWLCSPVWVGRFWFTQVMSPTPSVEKDLGIGSQGMWQAVGGTGHVTGRWAVQKRSMAATGGMQGCGSCGGMRVDPGKKVRRQTVGAVAQAQRPHHQASWLGGAWHHLWKTSHSRVFGLGGVCKMMCTTLKVHASHR